jgi:hypothetical protein
MSTVMDKMSCIGKCDICRKEVRKINLSEIAKDKNCCPDCMLIYVRIVVARMIDKKDI